MENVPDGRSDRRALILAVLLAGALASASRARAVTYQVNSAFDVSDPNPNDGVCETTPGVCTLRAAVQQANVTGGTILVPAITIKIVQSAPIAIDNSMSIVGAGMLKTVVSGDSLHQIFTVGTGEGTISVSISDMTLRDGVAADFGGAIFVGTDATLTVARCRFTNNVALRGSAILCGGSASTTNLVVKDSVFVDNHGTANSVGGAVSALYCNLAMTGTTVESNTATWGAGVDVAAGTHRIANSTIARNTAHQDGGGILAGGSVTATNLALYSTTVAGNLARFGSGGGIIVQDAFVGLENSILAYNRVGSGFIVANDCNGSIHAAVNVIVSTLAIGCTVTGTASIADPHLGPFQDNGGPGRTFALLANSPAIDAGTLGGCPSGAGFLATDVRGAKRVVGTKCDIGAYERTPCGDANGDGALDVLDAFFVISFLFAGGPLPPGLANVNGDAAVDVLDVFVLINRLFAGGTAPSCPGT